MAKLIATRALVFIPQLLGITFITFVLVRLLPGDPATRLAGTNATPENIEAIRRQLKLNEPIFTQFFAYVERLLHGDLGISTVTFAPVAHEITTRLPATAELVLLALLVTLAISVTAGIYSAINPHGLLGRLTHGYSMTAGAVPDFLLGLLLIYFGFTVAGVFPSPAGQLAVGVEPPTHVTGAYALDALLTGDTQALGSALAHLVLPVATLVLVYTPVMTKQTRTAAERVVATPWMRFAITSGVSRRTTMRYTLRNVAPEILTVTGVVMLFLIGGAVLVEQVFSWGGLGQYAVQSIGSSDYPAIQGFVLVAATISLVVNLVIDLLYAFIDPRIRYAR
jgi:ABC-type dipeptide/oligopeptide/nickel transport system permease component